MLKILVNIWEAVKMTALLLAVCVALVFVGIMTLCCRLNKQTTSAGVQDA